MHQAFHVNNFALPQCLMVFCYTVMWYLFAFNCTPWLCNCCLAGDWHTSLTYLFRIKDAAELDHHLFPSTLLHWLIVSSEIFLKIKVLLFDLKVVETRSYWKTLILFALKKHKATYIWEMHIWLSFYQIWEHTNVKT